MSNFEQLIQEGRFEEAIRDCTRSICQFKRTAPPTTFGDCPMAPLLLGRATAMIRLARKYKETPAAMSEVSPCNGPDACTLGELALRDVEKVIGFHPSHIQAWILKVEAHLVREEFILASQAVSNGLQCDPLHPELIALLHQVNQYLSTGSPSPCRTKRSCTSQQLDELDCPVCMKLLCLPVTVPCGHTFCKPCLVRACDHNNKCPCCRTMVMLDPSSAPVTIVLHNFLRTTFPEEYAQREKEMDTHGQCESHLLPLFVMTTLLPYETANLTIFEPRYRLLTRRAMATNRRVGLIDLDEGTIGTIGCECEIIDCNSLPDGRFHLRILALHRFRLIECTEVDGYRVAKVEKLTDFQPHCPEETEEVMRLAREMRTMASTWVEKVQACGSTQLCESLDAVGPIPDVSNLCGAEMLSFWLARVLPLPSTEKIRMLSIVCTKERLLVLREMMSNNRCVLSNCSIM